MKPLVVTVRALQELATGLSFSAISESSSLYRFENDDVEILMTRLDRIDSQRIVIIRTSADAVDGFLPLSLTSRRREALSRLASFAERALTLPLSLPRGWNPYRVDNFVTFFMLSGGDPSSSRWLVELGQGEDRDITVWRTTTSATKTDLAEFAQLHEPKELLSPSDWERAVTDAAEHFESNDSTGLDDIDMFLPNAPLGGAADRSFTGWLDVATAEQRAFIEAPSDRSIRLLGPAGSGKTLALTLKAVGETLAAQSAGSELRVLFVTHSWALATQISNNRDALGLGRLSEIEVLPLLEIARYLHPSGGTGGTDLTVLGDDSLSGKQAQLDQILEVVADFVDHELLPLRRNVSPGLLARLEATDEDTRRGLAWDLLVEFGSVIGAANIFPGAGSLQRYRDLPRSGWMLPLETQKDQDLVFKIYEMYMQALDDRGLVTSDQVLADFLGFLVSHAWNRSRKSLGYDLVFVDEFHLFSPLERQIIHFLTREVAEYPKVFMALDPRQSPSEVFLGAAADTTRSQRAESGDEGLGEVESYELTTVHRFTPQILQLVKHVHWEFPTLDLGAGWSVDFRKIESDRADGPRPLLIRNGSRTGEEDEVSRAVQDLYSQGRIAIAVVDPRHWSRYSALASAIGTSKRFSVTVVAGRSDIDGVGYRKHGLVVSTAEYLAGLQFDTVLVVGMPEMRNGAVATHQSTRLLSLLYLALSRAEQQVRIFVNDEDGEAEVLTRAVDYSLLDAVKGSDV